MCYFDMREAPHAGILPYAGRLSVRFGFAPKLALFSRIHLLYAGLAHFQSGRLQYFADFGQTASPYVVLYLGIHNSGASVLIGLELGQNCGCCLPRKLPVGGHREV